ncbi:hypothetical protein Tco_1578208 [Tanacetum coccineum]
MEILLELTSNKLMVEHAEFDESDTHVLERLNTLAGNPVKEILLKLNLPDHRILKDGGEVKEFQRSFRHSDTERLSRSDEVLKLKNFKKDATLKLFKSTNQDRNSPNIPKRLEKDYHSIKDDVPLVSANTIGNVLVRGMLILDVLLTAEIIEMDDFKEITPSAYRLPTVSASPLVTKKRKQIAGESSSPQKSLKITIKQKQIVEKDDDDFEDRIEPESHKDNPKVIDDDDDKENEKILSSDKKTFQELTDIVSNPTTSTSKHSQVKKIISSKYSHLPRALRKMCRRQANLKLCILNTIVEDRDAFRSEVPAFSSKELKAHAPAIIKELFKNHVQSNVIHVYPTTTTSTKTKSSANLQYQLEDDFHSHHDEHQDDDAPPEGEKRVKMSKMSKRLKSARDSSSKNSRKDSTTYVSKQQSQHQEWDAWEEENVVDEDEVISEDVTPELIYGNTKEKKYIFSLHKIHTEEFLEPNLEEKLNRWVQKEFKTFNEDARLSIQHWKDSWHKREYKQNQKKVRKNPKDYYSNHSKDEKRVVYLEELVKFFDATLEKVLNEVKLRMFESKFLKKPHLLGELDQDIIKAYEREISKRLSHRRQMRRWEPFVNGRPILPTMKRL